MWISPASSSPLLRRWDYFKDDFAVQVGTASDRGVGTATDPTVLKQFQRSEPIHGANPGWLGNLFARNARVGR